MFHSSGNVAYFCSLLVMSIVGTFGNICALVAVVKSPVLRKRNNALLVSMSFADLLITAFLGPLTLVQIYFGAWPLNAASCRAYSYLLVYSSGNSLVTVTLLTLQCYVKITKSAELFEKLFGWRKVVFYLFYIWVGSILPVIMPEYGFGRIVFVPTYSLCSYDPFDFNSWLYMTILMTVAGVCLFPVPLAYYRVFHTVRNARKRVRNLPANGDLNNSPSLTKEELRIIKVSTLVTFAVMIAWVPLFLSHILQIVVPTAVHVYRPIAILLFLNSAINPYMYGWMNKHYGNVYRQIFRLCFKKEQTDISINTTTVQVID